MTPRLLVLDDEQDLLYLYQLILEPEGYDVHLAASGFEQVTDIEHFQPDLLILDYHVNRHRWCRAAFASTQSLSTDRCSSADPLYCRCIRHC